MPAQQKEFTYLTKKPTRTRKATIKSSTAPRPKTVAIVHCVQTALEAEQIIKSWKKLPTNLFMTRCMKDCKPPMQKR